MHTIVLRALDVRQKWWPQFLLSGLYQQVRSMLSSQACRTANSHEGHGKVRFLFTRVHVKCIHTPLCLSELCRFAVPGKRAELRAELSSRIALNS